MLIRTHYMRGLLAALLWSLASAGTAADCSAELVVFDERLAGADAAERNEALARQMRDAVEQMCGFLDEAGLQAMLENLDELLPPADGAVARKSAGAAARREARTQPRPSAAPETSIDLPGPTGRTTGAGYVPRSDRMHNFWVWDMDRYQGRARVLFTTHPSLAQSGDPDWKQNVYVAQIDPDGGSTLHLLDARQLPVHAALALQRGQDGVFVQLAADPPGPSAALELWSIAQRKRVSSVPVPDPPGPDGVTMDWAGFRVPTSDGNVFYASVKSDRHADSSRLAWFEAAPAGQVLGRGSLIMEGQVIPSTWVATANGGGGLLFDVSSSSADGVASRIETPIRHEVAGRQIRAVVSHETRFLETADDQSRAWQSDALQRMLMWQGELAIPQNLPPAQMFEQNRQQMALMERTALEYNARRTVATLDIGLKRQAMIVPRRRGYAVLTSVTANRSLEPAVHGPYVLALNEAGITTLAYLQPMAEALEFDAKVMTVSPDDEIYLAGWIGRRNRHVAVLRLAPNGQLDAWARVVPAGGLQFDGLVPDETGVWVIAHGVEPDGAGNTLWTARVSFATDAS